MAQKGLQDHAIRAAMKAGIKTELLDGTIGGLTVRVFASGEASWSFRYRPQHGGGYKRVTLGRFPDVLDGSASSFPVPGSAAGLRSLHIVQQFCRWLVESSTSGPRQA